MNGAGVVAALAVEARTLTAKDVRVAVSGMGQAAAARAARGLLDDGATALVSWGMAGALDPNLAAGTICLPAEVIDTQGTRFATARAWRESLVSAIGARPVTSGTLLTNPQPIDSATAKQAAYRRTGAVAVDMESAAVAEVAVAHGVPFIAVRVIVDVAADSLPPAVLAATQGGQVALGRLLRGLLRSPADIVPLMRLARRYRTAIGALEAVGSAPGLRLPA